MSDTVSVDTNFVVYAYMRKNGTPYYIGKGRPERPYKGRGRPCKRPSDENRIIILHENINEQTAFRIEMELIAKYKRKDLYPKEGLLYNKSDGGEGSSGTIVSEETRKKQSESRKGKNNYNYTPRNWYHPEHGEVLQKSSRELAEMFPDLNLNTRCLDSVYRREKKKHKGWILLEDKDVIHRRNNNILRTWYHKDHGVVEKVSISELAKMYPEQKLTYSGLSQVAKNRILEFKGWSMVSEDSNNCYQTYDWYHPEHGIVLNKTASELSSNFPNQGLDNSTLNRVAMGFGNQHKGWRYYDRDTGPREPRGRGKNKKFNWYHPDVGEVLNKTVNELAELYSGMSLVKPSLYLVASSKAFSHKKWVLLDNKNKTVKQFREERKKPDV